MSQVTKIGHGDHFQFLRDSIYLEVKFDNYRPVNYWININGEFDGMILYVNSVTRLPWRRPSVRKPVYAYIKDLLVQKYPAHKVVMWYED